MMQPSSAHTIAGLLRRSYRQFAPQTAMIRPDGAAVTYEKLEELATRTAGGLAGLGVGVGDRVVVALRNSPEFLVLDHALLWRGGVRVAVSFRLHAREIAAIASNAEASVVVVDVEDARRVADELAAVGSNAFVLTGATSPGWDSIADLATSESVAPANSGAEDLAWMPYTSGTTGAPKGVMHTQSSILAALRNMMAELPPVTPADTVLQIAPLSHLAGWLSLLYSVRGATQVFMSDFEAKSALEAVEKYRITAMPVVPTIVNLMTEAAEEGDYDTSSLRTILYAGSPIAADRLARAVRVFGPNFVQMYGLTEIPMPIASLSRADHDFEGDTVPKKLGSAGHITPFVEVRVVDDDGRDVATGDAGEIWVRADTIMRGYWRLPEESANIIHEGGWYGTGDVGRLEDGYLFIVDRKRDMIVSGGFNVFPSEVEGVISAMPGVVEVAVVGVPHPRWGESVMAVIVAEPDAHLTEESVIEACRAKIAGYKLPRRVEFVEALPKNPGGKLQRRDLRARYWDHQDRLVNG